MGSGTRKLNLDENRPNQPGETVFRVVPLPPKWPLHFLQPQATGLLWLILLESSLLPHLILSYMSCHVEEPKIPLATRSVPQHRRAFASFQVLRGLSFRVLLSRVLLHPAELYDPPDC